MAGERSEFHSFRTVDEDGSAIHGRMVPMARHENPGADRLGSLEGIGRGVIEGMEGETNSGTYSPEGAVSR